MNRVHVSPIGIDKAPGVVFGLGTVETALWMGSFVICAGSFVVFGVGITGLILFVGWQMALYLLMRLLSLARRGWIAHTFYGLHHREGYYGRLSKTDYRRDYV